MNRCSSCGRENDDSFSFCLDCGASLKPDTPSASTPSDPVPAPPKQQTPPVASNPAPTSPNPVSNPEKVVSQACPQCQTPIQATDAFCSSCGHRLGEGGAKGQTMFMHVATPHVAQKPRARLVLVKPDGSEGTVFSLAAEKTTIGRSQGTIMFPKDVYISPRHAELFFKDGQLTILDCGSLNGIYRKMTETTQIHPGSYFRIGRQLLRLEAPGNFQPLALEATPEDDSIFWGSPPPQVWARLLQVLEGGKIGEIHLLTQVETIIGREDGEILFPEDSFISSRHCKVSNKDGICVLQDLGSSNGTYLRLGQSHTLKHDDRIQIGNQVLKVDLSSV